MSKFASIIATAIAAFSIAVPVSAGQIPASVTPAGNWETATGESRYKVVFCGADGTQICATLTWLRDDVRTPENLAYLNKMVVQARKSGPVQWQGKVVYEGNTYSGSVEMLGSHKMKMYGCKGPACESLVFNRI